MADLQLSFGQPPNPWLLMARAALPKPSHVENLHIPRMVATLSPSVVDGALVARYRELCGFAYEAALPVTFPHVLAAPLHLALLSHAAFPLRLVGAVHVRNHIQQARAIEMGESIGLEVSVEGHTDVEGGVEVVVHTAATASSQVVWRSDSTMLIRSGKGRKDTRAFTPPDYSAFESVATVQAAGDMGRRYGAVARDFNPIHVHALGARAFGFPRALAHGMWTFARCASELLRASLVDACTLDVAFKRPFFLPGKAFLVAQRSPALTTYALHDGVVKTVFLTGSITRP